MAEDQLLKYTSPRDGYGLKPCGAEHIERLRDFAKCNCLNIRELFAEYDPLDFGCISENLFRCVMDKNFAGVLSPNQMSGVMDFFRQPDGQMCYLRLHELICSEENVADQLRECASKVKTPVYSDKILKTCGSRVYGTEPCVPSILERLRTAYWRLKIKITDLFRCCDPKCEGVVPEKTFVCTMNDTLVPEACITQRQLEAITNFYRAYDDKIDYKKMSDMFESTLSIQEQIQSNYRTKPEEPQKAVNALLPAEEQQLKDILNKIVYRSDRFSLSRLGANFDVLAFRPAGDTSVKHLKSFLDYLKCDLAQSDFMILCKKYATQDYTVNFIQLIEDLEDIYQTEVCLIGSKLQPMPGLDGPPELDYIPRQEGAGRNSSLWGRGICDQFGQRIGEDCNPDAANFVEGGTVMGKTIEPGVLGSKFNYKSKKATRGQGYAGDYANTTGAGKSTGFPMGVCSQSQIEAGASDLVDLRNVIERIQQFVYQYRIRVKELFKDFDPLNHGECSANRFRRALTNMGIGPSGKCRVTEAEFDALINYYRKENDPNMACWRRFDEEVESIFVHRGLETSPLLKPASPARIANLPPLGSTDPTELPDRIRQLANCAITRLKNRVKIESCNIKYFFLNFDRVNTGYISRQQFKQVLAMLNYYFTEEELEAISVKFCNDRGFNYLRLLDEIDPKQSNEGWYIKYKAGRLEQLRRLDNIIPNPDELKLSKIMYKIQSQIIKLRTLGDFLKDHDMHSQDRIQVWDFHRALDRAGFSLTPKEVEVLTCCFQSPHERGKVEWRCFLNSVTSVLTVNNLEKGPRLTPKAWRPLRKIDYEKYMTEEEQSLLMKGMRRLALNVYIRRLEFKQMLQDFDRTHSGYISESQFHRVLHTMNMASITTPDELDSIVKRFLVIRGNQRDVDYYEFVSQLEAISYVDPITLEEKSPTGVRWYQEENSVF